MVLSSDKVAEMFARHYLGYLSHAAIQPSYVWSNTAGVMNRPESVAA